MSYSDNEINMESEKSLDQSDQRNICFENISQKFDTNIINAQKNDLCLKKSEETFDPKLFMRINSNYEHISQDSKCNESIYFNIRNVDNKQSFGEDFCEDKLFFSPPVEFNKEILPKLPVFYPVGKELLNKEMENIDLEYSIFGKRFYCMNTYIGKIFFNWYNALKKYFSNNDDIKKYFSKFDPYFLEPTDFYRQTIYFSGNYEFNRETEKKLSKNLEYLGIVNRMNDYLLQKLFKIFYEIFVITITNMIKNMKRIIRVLEKETLRKFFIRRIRDYIKYIKKNKNNLYLKLEQQKEENKIFVDEFLKKKQPPFEFTNGGEKKYFQSHSLNFFLFIITRNIIILIYRELMKEDDDYLKKVFKFKKYPNYYLKLKEALSLF